MNVQPLRPEVSSYILNENVKVSDTTQGIAKVVFKGISNDKPSYEVVVNGLKVVYAADIKKDKDIFALEPLEFRGRHSFSLSRNQGFIKVQWDRREFFIEIDAPIIVDWRPCGYRAYSYQPCEMSARKALIQVERFAIKHFEKLAVIFNRHGVGVLGTNQEFYWLRPQDKNWITANDQDIHFEVGESRAFLNGEYAETLFPINTYQLEEGVFVQDATRRTATFVKDDSFWKCTVNGITITDDQGQAIHFGRSSEIILTLIDRYIKVEERKTVVYIDRESYKPYMHKPASLQAFNVISAIKRVLKNFRVISALHNQHGVAILGSLHPKVISQEDMNKREISWQDDLDEHPKDRIYWATSDSRIFKEYDAECEIDPFGVKVCSQEIQFEDSLLLGQFLNGAPAKTFPLEIFRTPAGCNS